MRKPYKSPPAVLCGLLATALLAILTLMASSTFSADASTMTKNSLVTLYGWPDNSPPGNTIAFPKNQGFPTIHNVADGVGTFSDPITFATSKDELSPGTVVYYPFLHRYFIMEDDCAECDQDWSGHGPDGGPHLFHIDLWVDGQGGDSNTVQTCEDSLTQSSAQIIIDPPSNESVDTTPLFDPSTKKCYNPSSFKGGTSPTSANQLFAQSASASPQPSQSSQPSPLPSSQPSPQPTSTNTPAGLGDFFSPAFTGTSFCQFQYQEASIANDVLTVSYPAGSSAPSAGPPFGGAQICIPSSSGPQSTMTLSYSIQFPSGFQFNKGGVLPGLYGGVEPFSGGRHNANGWSMRLAWGPGGTGVIDAYISTVMGYGKYFSDSNFRWLADGQWHTVTERVTINKPGQSNGSVTVNYAGRQVIDQNGIDITDTDTQASGLFFSTFYGGHDSSWAPTVNESISFKGFTVAGQ